MERRLYDAPVEVVEKTRQPTDHDLMVVPSLQELPQKELVAVIPQRGQHLHQTISCLLNGNYFGGKETS